MRVGVRKSERKLDRIDLNILRILQQEGRISYVELADKVGLSTTPCMERVKRLEQEHIIEGYQAIVNPTAIGLNLLVFVEISLHYQSPSAFDDFKKAVSALPNVMECHLISGQSDYLLKTRISEMSEYRQLLGDLLINLPGIKESKSYIVMEAVKENQPLPVTMQDNA
jgi:Lrp/AsnC family leucine-responsive transcriptional regulator